MPRSAGLWRLASLGVMALAAHLNREGLETEVEITGGGLDNVRRLAGGDPDTVALAPSNVEHAMEDESLDASPLETLGSVAWEPIWLFYRAELDVGRVPDLRGLKVATGAHGTVVHYVAMRILELNGVLDAPPCH